MPAITQLGVRNGGLPRETNQRGGRGCADGNIHSEANRNCPVKSDNKIQNAGECH